MTEMNPYNLLCTISRISRGTTSTRLKTIPKARPLGIQMYLPYYKV